MTITPERIAELRRRFAYQSDPDSRDIAILLDLASTALTARKDALREAAKVASQAYARAHQKKNWMNELEPDAIAKAILALIGDRP